jgi:ABC-2 type transport system permease protein
MMILSLATMAGLTLAISALALTFGTLYPQFETENAAQIPTSFGGLVFMMTTIALLAGVLIVLSRAVYTYVQSAWEGRSIGVTPEMMLWFVAAAALCTAATIIPLRLALRKMESFEF